MVCDEGVVDVDVVDVEHRHVGKMMKRMMVKRRKSPEEFDHCDDGDDAPCGEQMDDGDDGAVWDCHCMQRDSHSQTVLAAAAVVEDCEVVVVDDDDGGGMEWRWERVMRREQCVARFESQSSVSSILLLLVLLLLLLLLVWTLVRWHSMRR